MLWLPPRPPSPMAWRGGGMCWQLCSFSHVSACLPTAVQPCHLKKGQYAPVSRHKCFQMSQSGVKVAHHPSPCRYNVASVFHYQAAWPHRRSRTDVGGTRSIPKHRPDVTQCGKSHLKLKHILFSIHRTHILKFATLLTTQVAASRRRLAVHMISMFLVDCLSLVFCCSFSICCSFLLSYRYRTRLIYSFILFQAVLSPAPE